MNPAIMGIIVMRSTGMNEFFKQYIHQPVTKRLTELSKATYQGFFLNSRLFFKTTPDIKNTEEVEYAVNQAQKSVLNSLNLACIQLQNTMNQYSYKFVFGCFLCAEFLKYTLDDEKAENVLLASLALYSSTYLIQIATCQQLDSLNTGCNSKNATQQPDVAPFNHAITTKKSKIAQSFLQNDNTLGSLQKYCTTLCENTATNALDTMYNVVNNINNFTIYICGAALCILFILQPQILIACTMGIAGYCIAQMLDRISSQHTIHQSIN